MSVTNDVLRAVETDRALLDRAGDDRGNEMTAGEARASITRLSADYTPAQLTRAIDRLASRDDISAPEAERLRNAVAALPEHPAPSGPPPPLLPR